MIRSDSTTAAAVIPADVMARLEASAKDPVNYGLMDAAIIAYYPRVNGADIARAISAKPRTVQERIARLKAEKKI